MGDFEVDNDTAPEKVFSAQLHHIIATVVAEQERWSLDEDANQLYWDDEQDGEEPGDAHAILAWAADLCTEEEDAQPDYEEQRLKNICRNKEMLEDLIGVLPMVRDLSKQPRSDRPIGGAEPRAKRAAKIGAVRRSRRISVARGAMVLSEEAAIIDLTAESRAAAEEIGERHPVRTKTFDYQDATSFAGSASSNPNVYSNKRKRDAGELASAHATISSCPNSGAGAAEAHTDDDMYYSKTEPGDSVHRHPIVISEEDEQQAAREAGISTSATVESIMIMFYKMCNKKPMQHVAQTSATADDANKREAVYAAASLLCGKTPRLG